MKRSRVKGHHISKSESRPGDAFICAREPGNPHSPDAIVVKLGDSSGHVPDPLARILAPMLDGGVITCMEGTVTGVARSAREGVWVPGGGIEIPCKYELVRCEKYSEKLDKCSETHRSRGSEGEKTEIALCDCLFFCNTYMCAMLNNTRVILPHEKINPINITTHHRY